MCLTERFLCLRRQTILAKWKENLTDSTLKIKNISKALNYRMKIWDVTSRGILAVKYLCAGFYHMLIRKVTYEKKMCDSHCF